MNVAGMANLKPSILARATEMSEKFEQVMAKLWEANSKTGAAEQYLFKELMTNIYLTRDDILGIWQFLRDECGMANVQQPADGNDPAVPIEDDDGSELTFQIQMFDQPNK